MSSNTETTQASYRDAAGIPTRRLWQILVGVSVAVTLTVATVIFVNESDPPVVEQPLQQAAQSNVGVDEGLVSAVRREPSIRQPPRSHPLRSLRSKPEG